jgi:hypothetical protein
MGVMFFRYRFTNSLQLFLIFQVLFFGNSYASNKEKSSFKSLRFEIMQSDEFERGIRKREDQIFVISGRTSANKDAVCNTYIITMQKLRFMVWRFSIYGWKNNTWRLKLLYHEPKYNVVLLNIIPISKGFITENRSGMGRQKLYLLFRERNGQMNLVFQKWYDSVEAAYFKNYDGMPHLFGTQYNYPPGSCKENDKRNLYSFTDVYEWNNEKFGYEKIKTIRYDKKLRFKDRFNIKKGEPPVIDPTVFHNNILK